MENNKNTPIYAKVSEEVKKRATMYVTKSKLLERDIKTFNALVEEALDQYMIEHPL